MMRYLQAIAFLASTSLMCVDAFKVPVTLMSTPKESALKSPLFRAPISVGSCDPNAERPSRLTGIVKQQMRHVVAMTVGVLIWRGARVPEAHAARTRASTPPTTVMTKVKKTFVPAAGATAIVTGTGVVLGHKRNKEEEEDHLELDEGDSMFAADVREAQISDVVEQRLNRLEIQKQQARKILERIEARNEIKTNNWDKNQFKVEAQKETQRIFEAIRLERERKMNSAPLRSLHGSLPTSLSTNSRNENGLGSVSSNRRPIVMNGYSQSLAQPPTKSSEKSSQVHRTAPTAKTPPREQSRPIVANYTAKSVESFSDIQNRLPVSSDKVVRDENETPANALDKDENVEQAASMSKPNVQSSAKIKMYIVSDKRISKPNLSSRGSDKAPVLNAQSQQGTDDENTSKTQTSDGHQPLVSKEEGIAAKPISKMMKNENSVQHATTLSSHDDPLPVTASPVAKPETFANSKFLPLKTKSTLEKTMSDSVTQPKNVGPTVKQMTNADNEASTEESKEKVIESNVLSNTTSSDAVIQTKNVSNVVAVSVVTKTPVDATNTTKVASVNASATTTKGASKEESAPKKKKKKIVIPAINSKGDDKSHALNRTLSIKVDTEYGNSSKTTISNNNDTSKDIVPKTTSRTSEKLKAKASTELKSLKGDSPGDANNVEAIECGVLESASMKKKDVGLSVLREDTGYESEILKPVSVIDNEAAKQDPAMNTTVAKVESARVNEVESQSLQRKKLDVSKTEDVPATDKKNVSKKTEKKKVPSSKAKRETSSSHSGSKDDDTSESLNIKSLTEVKTTNRDSPVNATVVLESLEEDSPCAKSTAIMGKKKKTQPVETTKVLNGSEASTSAKKAKAKISDSQELKIKSAVLVAKGAVLEASKRDDDTTRTEARSNVEKSPAASTKREDSSNVKTKAVSVAKTGSEKEINREAKLSKAKTAAGRKFLELYDESFSSTLEMGPAEAKHAKLKVNHIDKLWKPKATVAPLKEVKPHEATKESSFLDVMEPTKAEISFTAAKMTTAARGLNLDESTMATLNNKKISPLLGNTAVAILDDLVMKSFTEGTKLLIRGVLWIHQGLSNHVDEEDDQDSTS